LIFDVLSYNTHVLTKKSSLDLANLNKEQKEAVLHLKGPLLIIAGAGTGKTSVITHRIAYLIAEKKAKPEEILALTFTDKAAAEMEERVDKLVPYGFVDTWILTFHAFGDKIIRENALDLGLPSNFKVLTRPEQVVFFEDNLMAFDLKHYMPLSSPVRHVDTLVSYFSKLKDEMIDPEAYVDFCSKKVSEVLEEDKKEWENQLEIAQAFKRYQELMAENGYLDFGDQINLALKLFKDNPKILKKYKEQFKFILVDEFQDTNFAQNELVKMLAGENGNITVVGDDDQSIYRFRGAAISNILDFKKHYPGSKEIILTQNYRSTQPILDGAYRLVKHNDPDRLESRYGIDKKLKAQGSGIIPAHFHCDSLSSEADKVAGTIKEKLKKGYELNDFAILVRKNSSAEPFMRALTCYGLPYKFDGSSGLYDRPEIRLMINFVKAIVDPLDSISLYHLAASEIYGIPVSDLVTLNSYASIKRRSLEWSMRKADEIEELKDNLFSMPREKVDRVLKDLEKFRELSKEDTTGQVLYAFLKDTDYLKDLLGKADAALGKGNKDKTPIEVVEAQVKVSNISKFFERVMQFEHVSQDKYLVNFKAHIEALMAAGEDPATAEIDPDLEAVNILTVHKSKGLEFKIVFLVNSVAGHFPTNRRSDPIQIPDELVKETLPEGEERNVHVQEERRLYYVGMTRAKEELYLTSAEDYGGARRRKVSQFVLESLNLPEVDVAKYKLSDMEIIRKFEKPKEVFALPKKFYTERKLTLSPHQIDDYLSCPKKFEFLHILKVPVKTFHAVVYGSAIHKAVEEYFARKMGGFKVNLDDVWRAFEENWNPEGFVTREHEEQRFQFGRQALANFFEREEELKRNPTKLEEWFMAALPDLDVKIRGRYDAIYEGREMVEIRDFKTSDVESKEKANDKAKKNRQLSIYSLAYLNTKGKIPDKLTLDFIDKGIVGESVRNEKDINKVMDEIKRVVDGIKANNYEANPGFGECGWCAYKEICPFTLTEV